MKGSGSITNAEIEKARRIVLGLLKCHFNQCLGRPGHRCDYVVRAENFLLRRRTRTR